MIHIANPTISTEAKERVERVLDSGRLTGGPEVEGLEAEFSNFCKTDYGITTSNGTTALHAMMVGCGIGEGDRVVTTPFSFISSANAIRLAGAEPVFANINPDTYNIDPDSVETILNERDDVAAVLAVHLFGLPADVKRLQSVTAEHDVLLLEDAAQAHGATVDGNPVGSFGHAASFSFYPTKNMTTGEGGIVVTDDSDVATLTRRFTDHGRTGTYEHATVGHNFRMTAMSAAIGRVQLTRLETFNGRRRENARRLTEGLAESAVETPVEPNDRTHVYHQYTVRCAQRDALAAHLEEQGVGSKVYYPIPIHQQEPYVGIDTNCPNAEKAAKEVLSIPVHPSVTDEETETIINAIEKFDV
jgi:dTDP-4-amino-4,6-dideoxygalactose transaminase